MIRVWVIDDEELAVRRLTRMLSESGRVVVAGCSTDPKEACAALAADPGVDAVFLDIEMPGMTGFDVLAELEPKPLAIFTTAYHHYAIRAFEANGTDYLLKPVSPEALDRALGRIEERCGQARQMSGEYQAQYGAMLQRLAAVLQSGQTHPRRLPSRLGDRIQFVDLTRVTHFFAEGKLTYAATPERNYVIDESIVQLEAKLDPAQFHRIHRAYLVNVGAVQEIGAWFAGKAVVRLNDAARSELPVSRDRLQSLKKKLGF